MSGCRRRPSTEEIGRVGASDRPRATPGAGELPAEDWIEKTGANRARRRASAVRQAPARVLLVQHGPDGSENLRIDRTGARRGRRKPPQECSKPRPDSDAPSKRGCAHRERKDRRDQRLRRVDRTTAEDEEARFWNVLLFPQRARERVRTWRPLAGQQKAPRGGSCQGRITPVLPDSQNCKPAALV